MLPSQPVLCVRYGYSVTPCPALLCAAFHTSLLQPPNPQALWVSVSADLVVDARRDIEALGMLDYDAVSSVGCHATLSSCFLHVFKQQQQMPSQ